MLLLNLMTEGEEKGGGREAPENFQNNAFSILEKPLCDIERALQKGHFCSFAEKDRVLEPQDTLVARLDINYLLLPF